jgi:hypothetical protein
MTCMPPHVATSTLLLGCTHRFCSAPHAFNLQSTLLDDSSLISDGMTPLCAMGSLFSSCAARFQRAPAAAVPCPRVSNRSRAQPD